MKYNYEVREVSKDEALEMVKKYHYSNTLPKLNKHFLGFFLEGNMVGLITLGWGTRPRHTIQNLFPSLDTKDYFEIGRMCMTEEMPRNSESQMIHYCIKWIKANCPSIKVLFTWADGMLGKVGYVYQSCSFYYAGYYLTDTYLKDGVKIHPRQMKAFLIPEGVKDERITVRPTFEQCKEFNIQHYKGKQYKYLTFLCSKVEKKRLMKECTYSLTRAYPKEDDLLWKIKNKNGKWIESSKPPYKTDTETNNKDLIIKKEKYMVLFYDFEVFKKDWLVVFIEPNERKETVIVNDEEKLRVFYESHANDIWVGFNSRHYDQFILKGILLGMNPKTINDQIIIDGLDGWRISTAFNQIPLNNYDVMTGIDRGLKYFEGSLGNSIEESSIPFDIDRKLNQKEIEETIRYCRHDVEQTIAVFMERYSDFEAQLGLLKMFKLPLSEISKTKVQLSAKILEASRKNYDDEFDIDFPETMRIKKYQSVIDWYKNPENLDYSKSLDIEVAGVKHSFGWGGVHGARENYISEGYFINMDVASLYPSLMIRYNLLSRSCHPQKFKDIVNLRLKYKAEKNPLQAPLKIVINGTYGASKDKFNPLYDPRQANRVCIYGQLLLLDLIEHLEPICEVIQSNTDGVLVKLRNDSQKAFDEVDDIAYEWEQRTGLKLEFDEFRKVIQKDVNNYIIVAPDGHWKSKGAYVKKLSSLDYDLSIVNKAVSENLVNNIPVEKTINDCQKLKDFQLVKKISSKYSGIYHGTYFLSEKCIRCFASKDEEDEGLFKLHKETKRKAKIEGTPVHSRLVNSDINEMSVPDWLDRNWYIKMAQKRVNDFLGVKE